MPPNPKYTLVRHSGWSVGQNPQFKQAVELTSVSGADLSAVAKVGGLIYNTYTEASNAEHNANWPPAHQGIIPRANGSFKMVKDLDVFIPALPISAAKPESPPPELEQKPSQTGD